MLYNFIVESVKGVGNMVVLADNKKKAVRVAKTRLDIESELDGFVYNLDTENVQVFNHEDNAVMHFDSGG